MSVTAKLDSRLWLPINVVNRKSLIENFESKVYDEKQCAKCDYLEERHCDVCQECNAFLSEIKLWKKQGNLIGVPTGDRKALKRICNGKVSIEDKRPKPKFKTPLKLVSKLYDYQVEAVKNMAAAGYGILQSPPRSGKTLMANALSIKLGYRTLILAAQHDWLEQFLKEWREHTNITDIEKWEGRKLIGICKQPEEMSKYDIVLATYQSFITKNGKLRLDAIKNKFGTLIVDEVHEGAAQKYAGVIASINARYKFGLTATPRRKDMQEGVIYKIIGPVKHQVKIPVLKPRLYLHQTGAKTAHNYRLWHAAMRFLFTHKKRNKIILKQLAADIKAGRKIMVPVTQIDHAKLLVNSINKHFGKKVAVQFTANMLSKKTRGSILDKARAGKIPVLVGTRKIVQTGLNIPCLDMLYVIAPISNEPKFEQETSRIKTKLPGKPQPIVRHFIEDFGPSRGCFRTCFWRTYVPMKFEMDKATRAQAMAYINSDRRSSDTNFGIV